MSRPLIGITTYTEDAKWRSTAGHVTLLSTAYAESVNRSGGRAVLIPNDDPGADVLDRLDGLILAGGSDVDPGRYGQPPHPESAWQPERDAAEFLLLDAALERDMPILAICRGLQLLVVAYGGQLHQHLPDLLGHHAHRIATNTGEILGEHAVRLEPGTRLHKILGDEVVVNSLHHQGILDPGRLTPAGWCPGDDLLEAAEDPTHSFVVGVQWHPERMSDPRLFDALVEASSRPAA
jgi:putative glutamine amidotransferase